MATIAAGNGTRFPLSWDEARRRVDRVHNDYVRTESQQLTNAKKLIQELEEKNVNAI